MDTDSREMGKKDIHLKSVPKSQVWLGTQNLGPGLSNHYSWKDLSDISHIPTSCHWLVWTGEWGLGTTIQCQ